MTGVNTVGFPFRIVLVRLSAGIVLYRVEMGDLRLAIAKFGPIDLCLAVRGGRFAGVRVRRNYGGERTRKDPAAENAEDAR